MISGSLCTTDFSFVDMRPSPRRTDASPDCSPLAPGGDPARSLRIAEGGWTFLAGEQGTRTITWPTEECDEDGGRFRINIMVERDVPSVGDADRETVELLVNCGFIRRP